MTVPWWVWAGTVLGVLALMAVDLLIVDRTPHRFTPREAVGWVCCYLALACAFGLGVWLCAGSRYAGEFFDVYLTEYALSADNLFVFVVIMSTFAVPVVNQHKALSTGIALALALRMIAVFSGAAVIQLCDGSFYFFGVFLVYTSWRMLTGDDDSAASFADNTALRAARKWLPVAGEYHGGKLFVRVQQKTRATPMVIVMVAIGTTDVLFAPDSIPAAFGLTDQLFLIFTAIAFASLGLRQVYFLLGGLLRKIVYLPASLSVILGFIGIKLILQALHDNRVPFINNGKGLPVPTVNITLALGVILGVLTVAVIASVAHTRRQRRRQHRPRQDHRQQAERHPAARPIAARATSYGSPRS